MKESFRERAARDRGRPVRARRRSGRRPGSAARANPRRARGWSTSGGAARRCCERAREAPPQPGRRCRGTAGEPEATAPAGADLRDPARDLRELPGAARGDRERSTISIALLPLVLPRIFRGWAWRWWRCWRSRRCWGCSSPGARPGGWPRCATPPGASARAISPCGSRRAAPTSWTIWGAPSIAWSPSSARRARGSSYMQKVSAWQEVARRLAHEIKNPLTPIQLAVQELALEVPRRRSRLPAAAGDRAGDPERGGRRDPPAGRRLLGLRQAPQGRAGARRSRPGGRGLRARAPRVAGGADASSAAGAGRRALRPDADPPRARQPGRERRPGRRGARAEPGGADRRRGRDDGAAPRSSSTTTAPAWPPTRASGSSTPTSRPRSTAPGWGWPSSARSCSTTAATCASPTAPSPLGGARFVVTLPAAARAGAATVRPASVTPGVRRAAP